MRLSKRLETVASFVPEGSRIADVGTDHGFVPISLAQKNRIRHGIAIDVRQGPLLRAQDHIRSYGLETILETRLSDGVKQLKPGEADTVIMAGIGGQLTIHILEDGKPLWNAVDHWILSPQSDVEKVRNYLAAHSFAIEKEEMVKEEGKYYLVMDVVRGSMVSLQPWESFYGPLLIRNNHPVLKEFLEQEKNSLEQILKNLLEETSEKARKRTDQLKQKLTWIQTAQAAIEFGEQDKNERRKAEIEGE
jgi:tRNA (adenine22-N1)-methyltransferase